MHYLFSTMNKKFSSLLFAGLLALSASTLADAADKKCSLGSPSFRENFDKASFSIKFVCVGNPYDSRTIAAGTSLVIGLTLYALDASAVGNGRDAAAKAAFSKKLAAGSSNFEFENVIYTVIQKPVPTSKPRRLLINDALNGETVHSKEPYDFAVQEMTVDSDSSTLSFQFPSDSKELSGYNYFLFAIWPASQKNECDRTKEDLRSGCKKYGFVLGDEAGVSPVDFYPGKATLNNEQLTDADRWLVERFR